MNNVLKLMIKREPEERISVADLYALLHENNNEETK